MKTRFLIVTLLLLAIAGASTAAFAKDAIQASVDPITPPTPLVMNNGQGLTPGNYAIGTIQLFYTVVAPSFPTGTFAQFNVNLQDVLLKANPAATFPANITLEQIGGTDILLTPGSSVFTDTGAGWTSGPATITISINDNLSPALNFDGSELVGNMRITSSQSGIDTTTNIQVHIKLVVPNAECFHIYEFVTDEAFTSGPLSSITVNVNNNNGKITSTNPYGQLSSNLLVVNACAEAKSFDARMALDSRWQTNPNNNPGNAVFTFDTAGEQDPSSFNILAFGAGAAQGQSLCEQNVTVSAGDMFLTTVHMAIIKGVVPSGVGTPFSFSGTLYPAASGCTGTPLTLTGNPASTSLTWTTQ